jgi:glycosyltransferase involved in cell wall biosynthesis
MRIYLVNRYFWPDESATSLLLTDLAEDLQAAGHEVTVFTSRQLYNQPQARLPERESWQGIQIRRLATSCFGRRRFLGRLLDILTFHLALRYGHEVTARPDAWFVMTDPPLIVNTVLQVRRRFPGWVVHHVDDVYPDLAMALGSWPRQGWVARWLGRQMDKALQDCDQVLALGACMARVLQGKGVAPERLAITPPWADGRRLTPLPHRDNPFRRELGLADDQLAVMYSGNMGQGHRFETILAAAAALARDDQVRFVFIGDGAKKPQIEAFRQARGLKNILLLPYQPRERLPETLPAGDLHLISLDAKVQGLIVPSKLAGILAVGRPAVFLGEARNSVAAAIQEGDCGYVIGEGAVNQLIHIIKELKEQPERRVRLGAAARRLFDREYDRAVVVPKIMARIQSDAVDHRN